MPVSSPSLCQGLFLCSTSVTIISFKDCPGLGLLKDVSPILPEYILPDVHIYLYICIARIYVSPCLYCQNLQLYQKACNACKLDGGTASWLCTSEPLHLHERTMFMMIMMTHHGHVIQLLHAVPWALSKAPIWCADLRCACVQTSDVHVCRPLMCMCADL